MKTFYFSFGQDHTHRVDGITFDCDSIVSIKAKDSAEARAEMFNAFDSRWFMQYEEMTEEKLSYFPRGVIPLRQPEIVES